jgi:predicted protein tyrosine phosphatase
MAANSPRNYHNFNNKINSSSVFTYSTSPRIQAALEWGFLHHYSGTIYMTDFSDCIYPGLHLGSVQALMALAQAEKEEQQDWRVITVLSEDDLKGLVLPRHIDRHMIIRVPDLPSTQLLPFFSMCDDFIIKARREKKAVLVHCMAGISRSATIVIAHLMMSQRLSFDDALRKVRSVRPIVGPNYGFREQLKQLEHTNKAWCS